MTWTRPLAVSVLLCAAFFSGSSGAADLGECAGCYELAGSVTHAKSVLEKGNARIKDATLSPVFRPFSVLPYSETGATGEGLRVPPRSGCVCILMQTISVRKFAQPPLTCCTFAYIDTPVQLCCVSPPPRYVTGLSGFGCTHRHRQQSDGLRSMQKFDQTRNAWGGAVWPFQRENGCSPAFPRAYNLPPLSLSLSPSLSLFSLFSSLST